VEQGLTEKNLSARRVDMLFPANPAAFIDSPLAQVLRRWTFFSDPTEEVKADRKLIWDILGPANLSSLPEYLSLQTGRIIENWSRDRVDLQSDFAHQVRLLTLSRMLGVSELVAQSIVISADPIFEFITASQPHESMVSRAEASMAELLKVLKGTPVVQRALAGIGEQSRIVSIEAQMALLAVVSIFIEKAIGNVLSVLLEKSATWELVRKPECDLEPIVREALRLESPTQITSRVAVRDFEFSGQEVLKGQLVSLVIGSANRDPSIFSCPDEFRLDRPARRTLTFGIGGKRCPGEWLSEMIVSTAVKSLSNAPTIAIDSSSLKKSWLENMESRRLIELSVKL
jgi:hypothetical protein